MVDVTSLRTDQPIRVDILDADGKKYEGKDSPYAMVFPAGSREYRRAYSKLSEKMAQIKDDDEKIDKIFDLDVDLAVELTESMHNLEFDGKDCADKKVLRQMYAAVSIIRQRIFEAARKPEDFLPLARND